MSEQSINLFDKGALVQLRVSYWSMRRMATKKDFTAMGINTDAIPTDLVNFGRKLLVPKEEQLVFNRLEQEARRFLDMWSVQFGLYGSHFVPLDKLNEICDKLNAVKEAFNKATDSFVKRFNEMVDKIKNDDKYKDFYDKCLKNHYPSNPAQLRSKFEFRYVVFKIAGLGNIQEASVEDVLAQNRIVGEKAEELRKQMKEEVGNFVQFYVATMRDEIKQFTDLVEARVTGQAYGDEEKPKKLTARSVNSFKSQIDRFAQMNIFGDNELNKLLQQMKENFLTDADPKFLMDNTEIKQSLTGALQAIRNAAAAEGEETDEFLNRLKRKVII